MAATLSFVNSKIFLPFPLKFQTHHNCDFLSKEFVYSLRMLDKLFPLNGCFVDVWGKNGLSRNPNFCGL